MADDLPDEFDLIVIGTGFPESCIAAAASRIGKTVLHIDKNDYYGGSWASFNLKSFNELLKNETRNASQNWFIPEIEMENSELVEKEQEEEEVTQEKWTQNALMQITRQFSIDLVPRLAFATGELVKLLISSNICRYAEFRAVDRVCTMYEGKVLSVPCSRSDVFNTSDLNIIEKRLLMKFLNRCMSVGEAKADEDLITFRNSTFGDYLKAQNVTAKISTCVRQAIAMCSSDTPFQTGLERTQLFLRSLGHYGNTPFLFPQYGCGELPQCFCRLCAVFGGIYYLHHVAEQIDTTENGEQLLVQLDNGKRISTKHVVLSANNIPTQVSAALGIDDVVPRLSRAVFLSSQPLGDEELNSGGGGVLLLRLVTPNEEREAILLQLARFTGTCPKGVYLIHLVTEALSEDPEADLKPFTQQVFTDESSRNSLLYSAFFTLNARQTTSASTNNPRVFCTKGPEYELDYDLAIGNAKSIFAQIYGEDVEFLPRAPDPEEIIVEGEDPSALHAHELPEDLRDQLRALEETISDMQVGDTDTSPIN